MNSTALRALIGCFAFAARCAQANEPHFVWRDVTAEAGLIKPFAGMMGHGAAMGDFDGDGKLDLFAGGFCDRPNTEYAPAPGPVPSQLLRNRGDGRFESVPQSAATFHARTSGAVFADLDNNGTLELYVANNAQPQSRRTEEPQRGAQLLHSKLLKNRNSTLVDISAESGACPPSLLTARNIGVLDYDNDGLLDLFVVEDKFRRGGKPRSALFRNSGKLTFEDVTARVGLPEDIFGLGLAIADLNADGRPDLFVPHSNRLFLSAPGNRYREAKELSALFAQEPLDPEDWPCGAAFGDVNRDGHLDLVISAHYKQARNRVFLNEGPENGIPRFREVTREVGFDEIVPAKCPHVEIQDFDNDGWPDIYMSAAWRDADDRITPLIFQNQCAPGGMPKFTPPKRFQDGMVYFAAGPSGDYDGDGRIDLFLVNWFAGNHSRLLRNESSSENRWLDIKVTGKRMNRMGIGAKVAIFRKGMLGDSKSLLGFQEIATGYGYASGQPALAHFGLGVETAVDVRVTLPDNSTIERADVRANQSLTIQEP